ncbi:MAG: hypothetical protein ABI640_13030 [Gammaproteobacteria bacterium]
MSDIVGIPVLSRQAFTARNVQFLDKDGVPYDPSTVEKRVITAAGGVITDWTTLAGFGSGDDVDITADEMELQDVELIVEKHIVLIVGDRDTDSENPLRIIVQVQNREKLP